MKFLIDFRNLYSSRISMRKLDISYFISITFFFLQCFVVFAIVLPIALCAMPCRVVIVVVVVVAVVIFIVVIRAVHLSGQ